MKKILTKLFATLLIVCGLLSNILAQAPEGIIYQAEARNESGEIIVNESLDVKITILESSANGTMIWEGNHKVITNDYGMFVLVVGTGTNSGEYIFNEIMWDNFSHFLNVKVKDLNSNIWIDMGTSQFLSVPYALHAKTASALVAEPLKSGSKPGVSSQTWSLFGNSKTDPEKDKIGTTDPADLVFITDNVERLRITKEGKLITADGVGLELGGNLTVHGDSTFIDKDLYVGRNVFLNVDDNLNPRGETINYGKFLVENNSSTLLTGELTVNGFSTLTDALSVDGESDLNSDLRVNNGSSTGLSGTLTVEGITNLNSALNVNGATTLQNTLNVSGNSTVNRLNANGQVTIDANLTGDQADYDNYPLRVEGGKHGIAIKVNSVVPSRNDNFISFMGRDGNVLGRVEGMYGISGNITSWILGVLSPPPTPTLDDIPGDVDFSQEPASMEFEGLDLTSNIAVDGYSLAVDFTKSVIVFGVNCIGAIVGAAAFGDIDDVVWSGIDVIAETINVGMWVIFETNFNGVAFESGGADYAEWLEKKNKNEVLTFGDVVGVKGGIISKDYKRAEKYMVVTNNPTVIGAMPDKEKESKYEMIAFMGQVHVKVIGKVKKGDYILPSGNQDGMAIAVSPNAMAVGDYSRIIGTAWGESKGKELFSLVNTAVGINSNDLAGVIENMQSMLNQMQIALNEVNPNYEPQLYALTGSSNHAANQISSSQTIPNIIAQKSGALEYETLDEALMKIKEYAAINNPNLNLGQFPYLEEMFENPSAELAQEMVDHYTDVLNRLSAMIPDTQN